MNGRLLYLEGDPCAPKYVAGALREAGAPFDLVRDASGMPEQPEAYDAFILSDFPCENLESWIGDALEGAVREGAGLLMVGGWKSFGAGGYAGSVVAEALPVRVEGGDDRVNAFPGLYPEPVGRSAFTEPLPFDLPVVLTGHNRVEARDGADVLVNVRHVVEKRGTEIALSEDVDPLVVASRHGRGRVVAFTSDLAPHWSGGLTDWGVERIDVGHGEEVGDGYVALVRALVGALGMRALPERLEPGVR